LTTHFSWAAPAQQPELEREPRAHGVIALDVYGTLVDPSGIAAALSETFGSRARAAAQLWREKQLEYTFRRALMRSYADFDICTLEALRYVSSSFDVTLGEADERTLLDAYLHLPAFPDVRSGLAKLQRAGYRLVALTNGNERSVRVMLENADIGGYLEAVLSAERVRSFKPDPAVYALLDTVRAAGDSPPWLVSGNPFDVIGAKGCGMKAAWLRRDPQRMFDPWEFSADIVARDLEELCGSLQVEGGSPPP
jgi:2-haloacid dehalogenase